ncbi:MAG: CvpA family protein [Bacillota bacterium]|nr:CvpA family protein [Bacillota bacterium]MDW7677967.1 CvpA family protein [Bacillota bacterium]
MNWMDYLLLGILAFSVIRGYQRGLIMTVASLASYLAGWWAATTYSEPAAAALLKTESVYQPLFEWLRGFLESRSKGMGMGHLVEDSFQDSWFSLPLPQVTQRWLQHPEQAGEWMQQTENWLLDQAAAALAQIVVAFVAFILVFLVVKNLVFFLGKLLNGVFKLPLLNGLNRGGGLAAGLLRGVLIIWVLLILATPLLVADPEGNLAEALRQSMLLDRFSWFSST